MNVEATLRALWEVTGLSLVSEGVRGNAVYVRWPSGRRSVLRRRDVAEAKNERRLTAIARRRGVPAPWYELVVEIGGEAIVVQELLPGVPGTVVNRHMVTSMRAVNTRCRGILAGQDVAALPLFLLEDGPGFCLHEPMRQYDYRTARLLEEIEEIGARAPGELAGDDLVHNDFHARNVLFWPNGAVSGVVDWDGAGRGNAYFSLVTLQFDLARRAPELGWNPDEDVPKEVALACWAHMALRQVDWSIRHAEDVTAWLEIAEALKPR